MSFALAAIALFIIVSVYWSITEYMRKHPAPRREFPTKHAMHETDKDGNVFIEGVGWCKKR